MKLTIFSITTSTLLTLVTLVTAQAPQIQLGNTTLVGRATPLLHVDFFGGMSIRFDDDLVVTRH
jgi:hypothetical protein